MSEQTPIPIRRSNPFIACVKTYLRLSFFMASPSDVPANIFCAFKAFLIYSSVNLFLLDQHTSVAEVMGKLIIELGLLAVFVFFGLKITRKTIRFLQTFSASV